MSAWTGDGGGERVVYSQSRFRTYRITCVLKTAGGEKLRGSFHPEEIL